VILREDSITTQILGDDEGELLLVPGPVSLSGDVQREIERPVRPHYGPEWVKAFEETTELLRTIFRTRDDVVLFFGPGSAALEASMRSCLHTRDRLLVPTNGMFAERLATIASANGIDVAPLHFDETEPIDPDAIRDSARAIGATALAVVYNETGSTLCNPLEDVCAVARELGLLTIVDAVSALGGLPLDVEAWGIDICVAVSNKCLGAPIGISPIAVSERAWQRCASSDVSPRGWYFNLQTWRDARAERRAWHPHPTTMPTSALHGLRVAAEAVARDVDGFVRHHADVATEMRSGLRKLGFRLYVEDERYASPVVTGAYALDAMDVDDYIRWLGETCRMRISPGLGRDTDRVFRVAHMGLAANLDVVAAYLELTRRYLEREP